MNAFSEARTIEQRSMVILRPFIERRAFNGQYVVTSKGPLARDLQKTVGDLLYNSDADTVWAVEVKCEEANKHGNFFFESWSNRSRFTTGWMFNLNTDLLLYHFLDDDLLYRIPFNRLRKWAFHEEKVYRYRQRAQSKYDQKNDTWGWCVPISDIERDLSLGPPLNPLADLTENFDTVFNASGTGANG